MPPDLGKTFYWTFVAYFLTKVHENWMHDYGSENTTNDVFYFSVSAIELEFQPIDFLACHFFITFIRRLTQMFSLILFSRTMSGLKDTRLA